MVRFPGVEEIEDEGIGFRVQGLGFTVEGLRSGLKTLAHLARASAALISQPGRNRP